MSSDDQHVEDVLGFHPLHPGRPVVRCFVNRHLEEKDGMATRNAPLTETIKARKALKTNVAIGLPDFMDRVRHERGVEGHHVPPPSCDMA